MKNHSKNKCSLEDEYRFEHLARIKAEKYIEEIWGYACELQKEVKRLQSIVGEGTNKVEEKVPLNAEIKLQMKLDKVFKDREKSVNGIDKIIKKVFK